MYDLNKINNMEDLEYALRSYLSKLERYYSFSSPKHQKYLNKLLDSINSLLANIAQMKEIDNFLDIMENIYVLNNNKSESVSTVKAKVANTISDLRSDRKKIMEDSIKAHQQIRSMLLSLWKNKTYREYFDDVHFMLSQTTGIGHLIEHTKKEHNAWLGAIEENERHEQKLAGDGISSVDSIVNNFELAKKHLYNTILTTHSDSMKPLIEDIKKETKNIVAIITPEKTKQTKILAERIKKSSIAMSDLDYIDDNLKKLGFTTNAKITELIQYVSKIIQVEGKKHSTYLTQFNDDLKKIELATYAIDKYKDTLTYNTNLEMDKQKIERNVHPVQQDIKEREKSKIQTSREIDEIRSKPKYNTDFEAQANVEKMAETIRQEESKITDDKKYIKDKNEAIFIISLPIEYTDMKEKLKGASTLKKVIEKINAMLHAKNGNKR